MSKLLSRLVAIVLLAASTLASAEEPELRLYVMDCGELTFQDISAFSISNEETPVRDLFVPCYLVDHPEGQMLWDAGLDPATVGQGDIELEEGTYQRYERSVIDQLAEIGFSAEEIDLIAISHMHFDHTGAANYFPNAELLIQQAEFTAAFEEHEKYGVFVYDYYKDLIDNPRTILNGDHDVFGDGRVRIVNAPGHTPGHQVLYLELQETGPLVLSGDLYHFRKSREHRRTPVFNTSREETLVSMEKVETLLESTGAVLWIEHDKALADRLKKSPAYYR